LTSSALSARPTFASYTPASTPPFPAHRFSVPTVPPLRRQVNSSAETKKRSAKRPPRQKTTSLRCPVSVPGTNVTRAQLLKQLFQSGAVGTPIESSSKLVAPMMVESVPHAAPTQTSTGTLLAGIKRKCTTGEDALYTLLLENGCKYSCVYFDGVGFRTKKPAGLTGSCCSVT